jgi:hypothetical protein
MPYEWDTERRRYTKPDGRAVTAPEQRKVALDIVKSSEAEMRKIGEQLASGKISTAEYAIEMRDAIKGTHSAMAQFAHGGKEQMGAVERGALGREIRAEYEYLNRFVAQIDTGKVDVKSDEFLNRSEMYGSSGWITYTKELGKREKEAGMTLERSFLEAGANHCQDCFDEAGKGWVPIGELIPIGERECITMCRCEMEYKAGSEEKRAA